MSAYLLRRLLLLPLTLFFIILVNFTVINLAPGEPTTITEISADGAARREQGGVATDERYLQFREFYGLTLPILFNRWPWTTRETVEDDLWMLVHRRWSPNDKKEMSVKEHDALRIRFGDRACYVMPILLAIAEDASQPLPIRQMAAQSFIRGGSRQGYVGANLTQKQKAWNQILAKNQLELEKLAWRSGESTEQRNKKLADMRVWFDNNKDVYDLVLTPSEKWHAFFFDTRFSRYFGRVLTLDFGTLRNDPNKTVISEVTKRFKYSLTLSILPMLITFAFCQFFGFWMAYRQHHWPDYTFNLVFLVLYAAPVFVVAPFLIEKIALHHTIPFTNIPIPISGFTSPEAVYATFTSWQRLLDTLLHIFLPIVAIMYGLLAVQSRLSRTAVLEVKRQDYVRTAKAKGLSTGTILGKHVGRNAAITIVTSLASSLGAILGGSLIVETLFDINGFGKFFYDAVINRDYNVIMFSAIAGAFLSLVGYLIADLTYTWLDPRVSLE